MIQVPFQLRIMRATMTVALLAISGLAHAETGAAPAKDATAPAQGQVLAVFGADDGRELSRQPWVTDGTRAGTRLLRRIDAGAPHNFADLGDGRLAFTALFRNRHGDVSREPFITDGTRPGTRLLRRIGESHTSPRGYTALGDGRFVFAARNARGMNSLFVSDGTRKGTAPIFVFRQNQDFLARDITPLRAGQAVFVIDDGRRGWEIWVTDGTREGTQIVRNITGDARGSNPQQLVRIAEGVVVFTADDQVNGRELWVTNGRRAGTRMLANIRPGLDGSNPQHVTAIGGGRALFSAGAPGTDIELWITDGTPAGTYMINDPSVSERARAPRDFAPLGDGRVLFAARKDFFNHQLWITDGTLAGTRIVRDIGHQRPEHIRALGNGRAVFWIQNDPRSDNYALWASDGTSRGTSRVQFFPNMDWTVADRLTSMGNGLALFAYNNGRTGWEPWVTDGTRQGTQLLRNIHRTFQSDPRDFTVFIPAAQ